MTCPFCGRPSIVSTYKDARTIGFDAYMRCTSCHARGPTNHAQEQADAVEGARRKWAIQREDHKP